MTTIALHKTLPDSYHPMPEEILVAGSARNLAKRLQPTIQALQSAAASLARVHTLVIESDSSDGTVAKLKQLAGEMKGFRYQSLGQLRPQLPDRTERLAYCRNAFLSELRDNPLYRNVTHLMVADLDGVCRDLTAEGLKSCWEQPDPWDVCTANQADLYYDIWALRHPTWNPHDCWAEYRRLVPIVGERSAREITIFSRMIHIPSNRPMIEVDSAFGGLAIYRREALRDATYCGKDGLGVPCCEHVPLHAQIKAYGHRIFINPAMINARRTRHASSNKFFRRFRRTILAVVRGDTWNIPQRRAA